MWQALARLALSPFPEQVTGRLLEEVLLRPCRAGHPCLLSVFAHHWQALYMRVLWLQVEARQRWSTLRSAWTSAVARCAKAASDRWRRLLESRSAIQESGSDVRCGEEKKKKKRRWAEAEDGAHDSR
jgi:hypothetical protein